MLVNVLLEVLGTLVSVIFVHSIGVVLLTSDLGIDGAQMLLSFWWYHLYSPLQHHVASVHSEFSNFGTSTIRMHVLDLKN